MYIYIFCNLPWSTHINVKVILIVEEIAGLIVKFSPPLSNFVDISDELFHIDPQDELMI